MKNKSLFITFAGIYILFIGLFFAKTINCVKKETEPFTAEAMHLLHRLSSFVPSPDNKYIVFVNRLWDKPSKKYYTNLQYLEAPNFNLKEKKMRYFL